MHSFKTFIINRHGAIMQIKWLHILFRKRLLGKHFRNFSTSICSEIKTKYRIPILYTSNGFSRICSTNNGFNKFIGNAFCIRFLHAGNHVIRQYACCMHHGIIRNLYSFPSFVSIHGIISSGYRSQFCIGCL